MAFRDDREALRQRIDSLTREAREARERAESLSGEKERADELEEELAKTLVRLNQLEEPRRPNLWVLAGAGVGALVIAIVVGVVSVRTSEPEPLQWPVPDPVAPPPTVQPELPLPPPEPEPKADFEPIAWSTRASDVTGRSPVRRGETCDVLIAPSDSAVHACRVTVSCGGEIIFGGEGLGYLDCALEDGQPTTGSDVTGSDDEGDPMLAMDLPGGTIRVSNDRPATWSFVLKRPRDDAPPGP